jgi:hypothetical protein
MGEDQCNSYTDVAPAGPPLHFSYASLSLIPECVITPRKCALTVLLQVDTGEDTGEDTYDTKMLRMIREEVTYEASCSCTEKVYEKDYGKPI